jgi:hypothetical protein
MFRRRITFRHRVALQCFHYRAGQIQAVTIARRAVAPMIALLFEVRAIRR